jgi:hypothetical protein
MLRRKLARVGLELVERQRRTSTLKVVVCVGRYAGS